MDEEQVADFKKLQVSLNTYFNLRELDELFTVLKIEVTQVPGQTKTTRAVDLIKAAAQTTQLSDLTLLISQKRPFLAEQLTQLDLPDCSPDASLSFLNEETASFPRSTLLAEQMALYFKADALRSLCFDFDIDHENLGGLNHLERIQNLVSLLEKDNRLNRLLAYLNQNWPTVSWIV